MLPTYAFAAAFWPQSHLFLTQALPRRRLLLVLQRAEGRELDREPDRDGAGLHDAQGIRRRDEAAAG